MSRRLRIFQPKSRASQARWGLTLIELLVTIAILGLLTAVAVPAVRGARGRLTKVQCQNNLREIAVLLQLHLDTPRNALTMPVACKLPSFDTKEKINRPPLYKALKSVNANAQPLFHCPDDFDYFDTEGLSYEYYAEWLSGKPLKTILKTTAGATQPASDVWVLWDFQDVHEGRWIKKGRNVLWLDWHITDYFGVDPEGSSATSDSSSQPTFSDDSSSSGSSSSAPSGGTGTGGGSGPSGGSGGAGS